MNPWPGATMTLEGETVKVFGAAYTEHSTRQAPGTVVGAGKEGIELACGGGKTLLITELQPAGKKRMAASAYLLGHKIEVHG